MSRLSPDDFERFFEEVHGYAPFPWQRRLAKLVVDKGRWPDALDVPTGAGKTAAIDIAVFHLAVEANRGPDRRAPVRILFVVDRRLVVDDAHDRAVKLMRALGSADRGVVRRVADALRVLAESPAHPLAVARLRGGTPMEPDWVRTPAQPTVVVSTVDQVGSRLLFRGYGVSRSMRPVHAGLLGADALFLLDEAHLSQPFVQTLKACRVHQEEGPWSADRAAAPFQVVTLSATQTDQAPELVKSDDRRHPLLGPRLQRGKQAELVGVRDEDASISALADRAWAFSRCGGGPADVVAVVANRVRRARAVFDRLRARAEKLGESDRADVALLTGRSRPLEREDVVGELLPRMAAQRTPGERGRPLLLVATQCIEAGADLDFDALVTEVAPLDCLRQRFGRLNRMGREIEVRASVVAAADQVSARAEPDPVYGKALAATWDLLTKKAGGPAKSKRASPILDFGSEASRAWLPAGRSLQTCLAPREDAPVLLRPFVERWFATSPEPTAGADVPLFLHGPRSGPADVQLIWRADLPVERVPEAEEAVGEQLAACPPSALEALAVPLWELRRWLLNDAPGELDDLEASPVGEERARSGGRMVACWSADEGVRLRAPDRLQPGDVVVVPSEWGGCDRWGWNPKSFDRVRDLGRRANLRHRGRDILMLGPGLLQQRLPEGSTVPERWTSAVLEAHDLEDADLLAALRGVAGLPGDYASWLDRGGARVIRGSDGKPIALERRGAATGEPEQGEATTETDRSCEAAVRAIRLTEHSTGVAERAAQFARQVGLEKGLVKDVATAAYFHDAGKAHPAFQRWLHGGDELAGIAGPVLAKSGGVVLGKRARERADLPRGARHEVASLAFATTHPRLAGSDDPELVLWLIGTHHGWGRPFFPAVAWPDRGSSFGADLGGGVRSSAVAVGLPELLGSWVEVQASLVRRYGPWGLARLEAIVRLADHRCSQAEQEERP